MALFLVDTGIWYALCDSTDTAVSRATIEGLYEKIRLHSLIVPWPIVYETLRTSFVRKRLALARFERELKSPRVMLMDDSPYREEAMDLSFRSSLYDDRPLSMVDCTMRLLLADPQVKIRCLVSFNTPDFVDVCAARRIELWSQ